MTDKASPPVPPPASPQTLTLPATLDALAQISLFITDAAEREGLDARSTWQVQLAVDEAATNVIQHAYCTDAPGNLAVSWRCEHGSFMVMLRDQGRGFDPQTVPEPDLHTSIDEREAGGLGIYLMTRLMDEVRFAFDPHMGNVVTMVKYMTENPPNDIVVWPLAGRLDALAAPQVQKEAQRYIEAGARLLLIDLSAVDFLSSSGLRSLLLVRKELMTLGGELRLAGAQPHVEEVFALTGFDQVFAIHATLEEARAAFGQSSP